MRNYVKTIWKDRKVEYPNRYKDQNGNRLILTKDNGEIEEVGTSLNAEKLNNIENGIEELYLNMPSEIVVDSELNTESENPLQNKVVASELAKKIESVPVATDTVVGGIKISFDETTSTLSINTNNEVV